MTASNLRATALTVTSARVDWNWSGSNPAVFVISISDGEGFFNSAAPFGHERSHTFTGLTQGTEYTITLDPFGGTAISITWTLSLQTDHSVDPGDVSWTFDVPHITHVDLDRLHMVDPGDVNWHFTTRLVSDYEVDPDDVDWRFDVPQTRGRITKQHVVNPDDVTWHFAVPTIPAEPRPDLVVEIDWAGDGSYSHAASDVSDYIVDSALRCTRGRNYSSQTVALSPAGRLTFQLWNLDNRFDRLATESVISGIDPQGKRIRVCMGVEPLWQGYVDDFEPKDILSNVGKISVVGFGVLSLLRDEDANVSPRLNITVEDAAELLMADSAVDNVDLNGEIVLGRWWVEQRDKLAALRELENLELGFLCEKRDGAVWLQNRSLRESGAYTHSALTLSDENQVIASRRILEIKRISNTVVVPVNTYTSGDPQTLWTSPGPIVVPANSSIQIRAIYPTPDAPSEHVGVASWIAPVSGTDYTAVAGLSVTSQNIGESLLITFANSTTSQISIPAFQARGQPLIANAPFDLRRTHEDSVMDFGERVYPSPSERHTALAAALSYADTLLNRHALLQPVWIVKWQIDDANWRHAAVLDLSRRITIDIANQSIDVFIEGITHEIKKGNVHYVTYFLTQVPGASRPFAPLAPTLTSISTVEIDVRWNAPFTGGAALEEYEVQYRQLGSLTWIDVPHGDLTTSTRVTGLSERQFYEFRVRARNSVGWSPWSGVASTAPLPNTPTNLRETSESSRKFTANWTGESSGDTYDLEWRIGTSGIANPATSSSTSYTVDHQSPGSSIQWRVRARSSSGVSTWSAWRTQAAIQTPVPSNLRLRLYPLEQVTILWTDNGTDDDAVDSFEIQRRIGATGTPVTLNAGAVEQYVDTSPLVRTAYQYRMRAKSGPFTSSWTAWTSVTTRAIEIYLPTLHSGRRHIGRYDRLIDTTITRDSVSWTSSTNLRVVAVDQNGNRYVRIAAGTLIRYSSASDTTLESKSLSYTPSGQSSAISPGGMDVNPSGGILAYTSGSYAYWSSWSDDTPSVYGVANFSPQDVGPNAVSFATSSMIFVLRATGVIDLFTYLGDSTPTTRYFQNVRASSLVAVIPPGASSEIRLCMVVSGAFRIYRWADLAADPTDRNSVPYRTRSGVGSDMAVRYS